MQANCVHMCICIAFRVKTSSEQIERYIRQGTNISEGTVVYVVLYVIHLASMQNFSGKWIKFS